MHVSVSAANRSTKYGSLPASASPLASPLIATRPSSQYNRTRILVLAVGLLISSSAAVVWTQASAAAAVRHEDTVGTNYDAGTPQEETSPDCAAELGKITQIVGDRLPIIQGVFCI